jgi:hypothetical protein
VTRYRLRYTVDAYNGRFRTFTYPRPSLPGYPTREIAEQMRAAMPEPGRLEVVEEGELAREIGGLGVAGCDNGGTNQQCPEPALTDPGRRPHPAKEL